MILRTAYSTKVEDGSYFFVIFSINKMTNVNKLIRKLQIAVTNIATATIRALLSVRF
ncbi:hypothetical protein [Lactococcus lactis]|uniref:Uncharacterized protein n=1 Tax=Lactococcus lactis subsp. lactis TaxID=1360 RepID=A0A0V8E5J3_LACLL|nr:hypothetical protein [Lactococcus lactis]KSU21020.1 hypothetical protein M20_1226 [Lactococcus lactis subsp. lactis]